MPNTFILICLSVLGLVLGSFVNVVALRSKDPKSIIKGRSQCPHCQHRLGWMDLVPILSFVVLRGRCQYCQGRISLRYPTVELLGAGLTLFAYWYGYTLFESYLYAVSLLVSLLILFVVALTDLQDMEVDPAYITVAGLTAFLGTTVSGVLDWKNVLLAIVVGAGLVALVSYLWKFFFKKEGMGVGDIWIAGAMGALLGYPQIIIGLMIAVMLGALVGIYLVLRSLEKNIQTVMPFGPFLFIGTIGAMVWANQLLEFYLLY